MRSIVVKLPNWMGDILFAYDLLYSLASGFERIGLCASSRHAELFDVFPLPNTELIVYPPEAWPILDRETITRLGRFHADAGLLLTNSFGSALIFRYAGVAPLYGYNREHRGALLSRSLPVPAGKIHQTDYYMELLRLFDAEPRRYPNTSRSRAGRKVVIHPGASKPPRGWHLERFYAVGESLRKEGYEVVVVSGAPTSDSPFPVVVSPTFADFSRLLQDSALFIGNDSGPLHFAQQCGCPVVGIYGPGDPAVTGPRDISPSRTIYNGFPCSPCRQNFFKECRASANGKPYCIEVISTEQVLKAARELLR